jgi:c-di-GMP-binding flagellar brake protein YcgR
MSQQKLLEFFLGKERWTSTSMNWPSGSNGSIDGRRYPRYEIDAAVDLAAFGIKDHRVMRGRSLNISEVGMAGLFVTGWPSGTAVTLKFPVPVVSTPFSVGAIVRNCTDHRYGFEFMELNPAQREIISKTCRTLALLG